MGAGLVALFVLVAIAVGIFINNESKMHRFKYLEEEPFETEYGVSGMVKELKNNYKDTYTRSNIIGTILCILSAVPLLCVGIMSDTLDLVVIAEEVSMSDDLLIKMTAIMLIIVAVAVVFFVKSGTIWGSYQRLLQEGEFTVKNKNKNAQSTTLATIYWGIITAIYLGWSFITGNWHITWIVWVLAGVLFPVVREIFCIFDSKNK